MTGSTDSAMTTAQARDAIAAHCAAQGYDLAREMASGMSHRELADLVVLLCRMYGGGLLESIQNQGYGEAEARQMTADQIRTAAQAQSILPGEDQ